MSRPFVEWDAKRKETNVSVAMNPTMNSVNYARSAGSISQRYVQPVEVWDLEKVPGRAVEASRVRTLGAYDRKGDRLNLVHSCGERKTDDVFESHRERKEGVVLAAILSVALLVGSAFGGAFSGTEQAPATLVTSQNLEVASAR